MESSQQQQQMDVLIDAIRTHSTQLQLDASNSKVRANHKRCVVVLRDIKPDTPIDEIKAIFDKCAAKCLHCEFAGNLSWYVSFKDELEAQVAVQFLKEDVQTFHGASLFARIKTHPIPRTAAAAAVTANSTGAKSTRLDGVDAIKSPLLSTKSDATDDDLSTADLLMSPPAATGNKSNAGGFQAASSGDRFGAAVSNKLGKQATFNPELGHAAAAGQQQFVVQQQSAGGLSQSQQNLQYHPHHHQHLPGHHYVFGQEGAYKYYINSSKLEDFYLNNLYICNYIKEAIYF